MGWPPTTPRGVRPLHFFALFSMVLAMNFVVAGFKHGHLNDMLWSLPFAAGVSVVGLVIPYVQHNRRVRRVASCQGATGLLTGHCPWPHRVMPGREWPPGSQRSQQFRRASRNDSQADSARSSTHQLQALVLGEVGEVLDVERRQWVLAHQTTRRDLRVVRRSRSAAKLRVRLQLAPAPGPPGRCTAGQPDPPETRQTSTVCSAPNAGPRPTWSALRASRM